jgi:Cdc6-like AAA superfamily ATPase
MISDKGLSIGQRICSNFPGYIADLHEEKKCFFIHYVLEKAVFKNIGIFDSFETCFKNFNVVYGSAGRGKTTFVKNIANVFNKCDIPSKSVLKNDCNRGSVTVDVVKKSSFHLDVDREVIDYVEKDGDCVPTYEERYESCFFENSVKCIILDDAGSRLTNEYYQMFLNYLKELNQDLQIILTVGRGSQRSREMFLNNFSDCNFIDLDSINSQERLF